MTRLGRSYALMYLYVTHPHLFEKSLLTRLPFENSVRVKGIPDELDVLEEDEVYLNLPGRVGVVVGKVVVCRNPAYHPGGERAPLSTLSPLKNMFFIDLRILSAVNRPELAHIRHGLGETDTVSPPLLY
jgi:hypothetical protein